MTSVRPFSAAHARALACVLDEIIPPAADGTLPGAGALGLEEHVAAALHSAPALREMVERSLTALTDLAQRKNARGLAALSDRERAEVLRELAASDDAVPPVLAIHAYSAYYQHPRTLTALGLEPRAPHPGGYTIEPNDLSLLDPVRRRAAFYRRC